MATEAGPSTSSSTSQAPRLTFSHLRKSFLWKSTPFSPSDFRVGSSIKSFKWTGKNQYFVLSEADYLSVGGGDGKFGLWIDSKFEKGFSATCPAFDNEPLTRSGWERSMGGKGEESKFEVVRFECWAVGL